MILNGGEVRPILRLKYRWGKGKFSSTNTSLRIFCLAGFKVMSEKVNIKKSNTPWIFKKELQNSKASLIITSNLSEGDIST